MFAVQFEDTATQQAIPVKNLVKYENPKGGTSLSTGTDQIWTYKSGEGWKKYYWYQPKSGDKFWAAEKTTTEIGNDITVSAGDSFFFVRSTAGADTILNVAGSVVALDGTKGIPVNNSQTVLLCNPWPTSIKIGEFCNYYTSPKGGTSLSTGTDQVWTYRGGVWQKYYYYQPKSGDKFWAKEKTTSPVLDSETIEAGEGFFFVRSTAGTDTTITFKGPEAK